MNVNGLRIDWNKFKSNAKGKMLEKAKRSYIEFYEMLDEVDFELIGDYINNQEKVGLVYKLDKDIKLNICSNKFKRYTYKTVVNFKNNIKKNGDEFIKFVGLTNGNSLIAKIKTFDGGEVEIDVVSYDSFNNSREDFYNKLKAVGGYASDYYRGNDVKMNIFVDTVELNPMCPSDFKKGTYKSIIGLKNKLIKNEDEFVGFIRLSERGNLVLKVKTFDNGITEIDIGAYDRFNKARQSTYNYCKEKGYKILSPYINKEIKMLIDFNCGHDSHWIAPNHLKQGVFCPICSESRGEKIIREYLEKNNVDFIQEYRFEECKYKLPLPFDFYIPSLNLCIEFDGRQHFEFFDYFGGEPAFKDIQIRDKIKNKYCKENNINLLRIPYYKIDNVDMILDKELTNFCESVVNKMRNNDIYMDFSFNGKRLSSFNGWIHTSSNPFAMPLLPNQELKSETIPSIGEVFVGKTLGARRWSLDIFFDNILDQREIASWLMTEMESEFYFIGDDVKINALVENTDDLEIYAEGDVFMGSFKIDFVAFNPYYYPIDNKTLEFTTFSQEIVFNNDGNRESFGEFDFTLNGLQNVKFRLNGNLFEISEARDRLLLNTEYHTCKDSDGNRRRSIVGNVAEFFYKLPLKSGRNTFTLVNGSISRLTIKCNSRYI